MATYIVGGSILNLDLSVSERRLYGNCQRMEMFLDHCRSFRVQITSVTFAQDVGFTVVTDSLLPDVQAAHCGAQRTA